MWPFTKKPNDYDKIRAKVGMSPAGDNDYPEFLAWAVVFDVLGNEDVINELKNTPVDEQDNFMRAYAAFYLWLTDYFFYQNNYPNGFLEKVAEKIVREFSKRDWYDAELIQNIVNNLGNPMDRSGKGGHITGVDLGPWTDVVRATNASGLQLGITHNIKFHISLTLYIKNLSNTIQSIRKKI